MKITEVRISKIEGNKLKAFASVTFDSCFVVTGIKIMDGNNGLFVAMPSAKVKEEYKDTCYPISKEFREELQKAVLGKYNGEAKQDFTPAPDEDSDDLPF
jgi:stage V sporulation protein G